MKRMVFVLIAVFCVCFILTAAADGRLISVTCEEEGFSTMAPEGCAAQYASGTGLQIFVETPGYIPYVIISRRPADMKFSNPTNYLNNVFREHMENQYGERMLGMNPAREWEIGGKTLLGARYMYKVGETTVCLLQLIEIREDGDVEYTAKFIDGEDSATMTALDAAVQYYATDAAEHQPETSDAEPDLMPAPSVAPVDMSGMEVDTAGGIYWAAITDTDHIEDGGYFTARLYLQDLYLAEDVEGLTEGGKIWVNGEEYTVEALIPHETSSIEIDPVEDFDGYIVFNKASDFFYTALVNDWVPCTHIADQKVMLPLPNQFSFIWIAGDEEATVYDADSFIALLPDTELSQYNTMLQFSDGLVAMIIHTSYPFGPEEE